MEILPAVGWLLIAAGIAGLLIRIGRFFSPTSARTQPEPATLVGELAERVVGVVESHPQGITLVEIGKELGIDWRQLIAPINQLLAEGRVEKRDRSYFPR